MSEQAATTKELEPRALEGEVVCESTKAACHCFLPADHEGVHQCDCGGSWDEDGFPHSFPSRVVW